YITNRQTYTPYFTGASYPYNIGHYRDPLPMSDGALVAAFANTPGTDNNNNVAILPLPPNPATYPNFYYFRLYRLATAAAGNPNARSGDSVPHDPAYISGSTHGPLLAGGISKTVKYNYNSNLSGFPSGTVNYTGPLWELHPVEVVARPPPAATA